jgi:DNA-binding IscR family transcriptional regulator
MSEMNQMIMDIQSDIADGILSFGAIAERYNINREDVELIADEMVKQEYDESMDGDFDSAMASAGYGTDEDYGYYGDE